MKITSLNTQRKNELIFFNFTHRKILFFYFLLSQFPFFNFLEKEKYEKRALALSFSAQNGQNQLGPRLCVALGRTQAVTWAWAGKATRSRAPAFVASLARLISAVRAKPTAER